MVEASSARRAWRRLGARQRGGAAVAAGLLQQAGLVEQLVALQHLLLVPARRRRRAAPRQDPKQRRTRSARDRAPVAPPRRSASRSAGPGREAPAGSCCRGWDGRPTRQSSQGKNAYQRPEPRVPGQRRRASSAHARQGEVADGDHMGRLVAWRGVPAAVAEGVELLDIAQRQARLLGHEGAQADFQRAVRAAGRSCPTAGPATPLAVRTRHQDAAASSRVHRHHGGGNADLDRAFRRTCAAMPLSSVELEEERRALERIGAAPDSRRWRRPCARGARGCRRPRPTRRGVGRGGGRGLAQQPAPSRTRRVRAAARRAVMKAAAVERLIPAQQWMTQRALPDPRLGRRRAACSTCVVGRAGCGRPADRRCR